MKRKWLDCVLVALFVAVSAPLLAQTCGILWQSSNPRPTSRNLASVAYGNAGFVAVGDYGMILTTQDGTNWIRSASNTPNVYNLHSVTWDGSRYVVAGDQGTLLTSPDGVRWTDRETGVWASLLGLTAGGGLDVAVGSQGVILTSTDGVEWTQRSSWTSSTLNGVVYGNGSFVAVGSGVVLTSQNGITWSAATSPSVGGVWLSCIAYGDSLFVASAGYGQVATSPDGQTWTLAPTGLPDSLNDILYDGSQFVAVGSSGTIATSPDGTAWTSMADAPQALSGVSAGGGLYVAVGYQGTVMTSSNGIQWPSTGASDGTWNLNGVASSGSLAVAVGDNGAIVTSSDLKSWSQQTSNTTQKLMTVTYGSGTFVAGGFNATVLTSTNGVSWTAQNPGVVNHFLGLAYLNGKFFATGDAGMLMTSPDGAAWSALVSNTSQDLYSIAFGGGHYVAVGNNGTALTSTDGTSWTPQTLSGMGLLRQVIYAGGKFVAVGSGVAVSPDGLSWTTQWQNLSGVAYSGGIFIGITSNGSTYTSLDGLLWAVCPYDGTPSLAAITLSAGQFLAVGASGRILTGPALPVITAITPTSGTMAGGTNVTISGGGFTGATSVGFGDQDASSFSVGSATSITARSPANVCGPVTLSVAGPSGRSLASQQCTYTYYGIPSVTSLSPATGPSTGGNSVTISGSNFTMATSVAFGTKQAYSFNVVSSHAILVNAPSQSAGTVDVTVVTPGGTSASSAGSKYTYFPMPSISSLSPNTGTTAGGTTVKITGSGFTGATSVKFGTLNATSFSVDSDTQVTAVSPAQPAGWVPVTVTNSNGTNPTYQAQFGYFVSPTLTAISPASGPTAGGTSVTITGTGFSGVSSVRFGSSSVGFSVQSTTQIVVQSPAQPAGTVDVTVTTSGGTTPTSAASKFTYIAPVPSISTMTPTTGSTSGGTSVAIGGSGFTGATSVSFGSLGASSFRIASDSSIIAVSPPQPAGAVNVAVTTAGGTSGAVGASSFTYVNPVPSIWSLSPSAGPTSGGTNVTISGSGFTGATSVSFGSLAASSFAVSSDGTILAVSPPEAAGVVDVTVATPGGTTSPGAATKYTYSLPLPVVKGLSPSTGSAAGGTTVSISGSGFTGATAVQFGGQAATFFSVSSDGLVTAISPAQNTGIVDVTVTTPGGRSAPSAGSKFTYSAVIPVVSSLSPSHGPAAGGTTVAILGANLSGVTRVAFGDLDALSFSINGSTGITALSPPHAPGIVTVTVSGPGGASTPGAGATFTYDAPPPTLSAIAPSRGTTAGATTVILTGTGFLPGASVLFGETGGTGVAVLSSTSLSVTTPSLPAGTVQVTVTNPDGQSAVLPNAYTFVAPPLLTGVLKQGNPLRLKIAGSGFQANSIVEINGAAVPKTTFKSTGLLVAKGGTILKAMVPKGGTVQITVMNPGDGTVSNPIAFTR